MFPQRLDSPLAYAIAKAMMDGFNRHYRLFRTESARAKHRFETADWLGQQRAQRERIEFYDLRVKECVRRLEKEFGAGSQPMDEVIFEEFKGTGNCEIHLDRRLYEKRVFPSIQLNRSGTRREELLLQPEILQKTRILRQFMYNMDEIEAMEMVLKSMKSTKNNSEFFDMMRRGG
jgi:hypothetical protein